MIRRLLIFACAVVLLLSGRIALSVLQQTAAAHPFAWDGLQMCRAADAPAGRWKPGFANPDRELERNYLCDGHLVSVHVAQYFEQGNRKEAVGGGNRVADGVGSRQVIDSGLGFEVREHRFTNSRGQPMIVWQWYGIGREAFASDGGAKLAEVRRILSLRPPAATVFFVAVGGAGAGSPPALRKAAESLWNDYLAQVGP